jgi:hypothetical protein
MKRNYYLGIVAIAVLLLVGIFMQVPLAKEESTSSRSTQTWEGILPGISTERGGTYAINIAMTQSTVGMDVSEESTTTNALYEIESVTHTTSGTPAVGFGTKKTWTLQQDAAGANLEDAGYIGFQWADETEDTEDADFVIGNMAAGAAAATKFTFGSTGILTLVGGATADNVTAATELNITETNIQLTGALDLEGGDIKVNDDSGDYNFAIETDSTDNAFSIDSGASTLNTDGLTVTFNQAGGDYDVVFETDNVTDALKVDAGTDTVQLGSWQTWEIATSTAQSYSISSSSKAQVHIQTYAGEATAHLMTDLLTSPGAGGVVVIKTGGTNDVLIDTEGAETIDGGADYDLDGSYESVMLINDGSNWFVIGPYLE